MPRGRKGRRNKDDPEKIQDEQSKREWAKDVNLDVFLPDEGFKKHIQNQSNKFVVYIFVYINDDYKKWIQCHVKCIEKGWQCFVQNRRGGIVSPGAVVSSDSPPFKAILLYDEKCNVLVS